MSSGAYDITSVEEDISKQFSTMSTENPSDLSRKKKSKKKRNSFVEMNAPVDSSSKKLKKSRSAVKRKSNETDYSDILDNVPTNEQVFPVSNDWQEEGGIEIDSTQRLVQPTSHLSSGQPIRSGTMNLFDSKRSNFSYYLEPNKRAILRCCPDMVINFNGVMSVKVLQGGVRIAGYTVTKNETRPIKVYSLNSYTYLPLELLSTERNIVKKNKLTKALRELNVLTENIQTILSCLEPQHCLLYIENLAEVSGSDKILFHMVHRLNHSIPRLLPDKSNLHDHLEKHLGLRFLQQSGGLAAPLLVQPPRWRDIFRDCVQNNQTARVVLCGGSGLGKTTLLRYLINRCIAVWGRALVLDLDPGQAEFFLPGTLTATVIDEPVLGPNFTQLRNRKPERCYFLGDVKIHSTAHTYVDHVTALLDYCHAQESLTRMPWFVNTMGYVRDQGLQLNCRIIRDTRPTHVIQITGKKQEDNFPADLTPQFVRKHAYQSQHTGETPGTESVNYDLVLLDSVKKKPFDSMNKCLKPADRRKLMLTAYFSSLFSSPHENYSVNLCAPYGAQLKNIQVDMTGKRGGQLSRGEILTAMNGELVALAASKQGHETPQCLGYGIVFCIDPNSRELFLVSPLPLSRMAAVKCLLLGSPSLSLPRKFLNPSCKELLGLRVPYACVGQGQVTSQTTSRTYRQPSRHTERATVHQR